MSRNGPNGSAPEPTRAPEFDPTANVADQARQIVFSRYTDADACSTTRLADDLGVTASHLCHAYKAAFGTTIGNDLRRLRVDLAKRLLVQRGLSIKQVAGLVGYEKATYRAFFNAFRAETGMPPSRYRRMALRRRRVGGRSALRRSASAGGAEDVAARP